MDSLCSTCSLIEYALINKMYEDDKEALKILRDHGVLPSQVVCVTCGRDCIYREDRKQWRCTGSYVIPKTKKRRLCNFSTSDYKGTFLENTQLKPWQVVCFVNLWVRKHFSHGQVIGNLEISRRTAVDWRSFCSEVTEFWFSNQQPIGGQDKIIEIDETLIVKRKYERGRVLSQTWLFGAVERDSKKCVVIPLVEPLSRKRDSATLIPVIKANVRQGSVIISDCWKAYSNLGKEGYTHKVINHSENFVDPQDKEVHTQNIERLWRDIKEWVKRPGIRPTFLRQYLGRYLFLRNCEGGTEVHQFLSEAARLYPPQSERALQQRSGGAPVPSSIVLYSYPVRPGGVLRENSFGSTLPDVLATITVSLLNYF